MKDTVVFMSESLNQSLNRFVQNADLFRKKSDWLLMVEIWNKNAFIFLNPTKDLKEKLSFVLIYQTFYNLLCYYNRKLYNYIKITLNMLAPCYRYFLLVLVC